MDVAVVSEPAKLYEECQPTQSLRWETRKFVTEIW